MSDTGARVFDPHTTAWRPLDLLASARTSAPFHGTSVLARSAKRFAQQALAQNPLTPGHSPTASAPPDPTATELPDADAEVPLEALSKAQWAQAFEAGRTQGRSEALQAFEIEQAQQHEQTQQAQQQAVLALWQSIDRAVTDLLSDPHTLHAPLKRLALHLAEELVLAELQLPPQAIDRLVQRCLDTLDARANEQVLIELHPDDLARLQAHPQVQADRPERWRWQADAQLLPGSVRVRLNETLVDDLIEHRLQALAAQLLPDPQAWSARSALQPSALAERQRQALPVEDALPRMPSTTSVQAAPDMAPDSAPDSEGPA